MPNLHCPILQRRVDEKPKILIFKKIIMEPLAEAPNLVPPEKAIPIFNLMEADGRK